MSRQTIADVANTLNRDVQVRQIVATEAMANRRLESDEYAVGRGRGRIAGTAFCLRPRIGIAKDAGLKTNRGILTDQSLRTSADNVYALGDCAEVQGHVLPYVLPLMASARALAKTLAGEPTPVSYGVMPVTIKTPACPVVVCPVPEELEGDWDTEEEGNTVKALFRDRDGNLRGYALTGDAVKEKMKLNKELPALMP